MRISALTLFALLSATPALAANQAEVSLTNGMVGEVSFNGIAFSASQLASQGYSVTVINGVVDLNRGSESFAIGTLANPGAAVSAMTFSNSNLAMGSQIEHVTTCYAVNAAGVFGIQNRATVEFEDIESRETMMLTQTYVQTFPDLDQCKSAETASN